MLNYIRSLIIAASIIATSIALLPLSVQAAPTQSFATTPDGVKVAIQEYGNAKGPEIVLVHGLLGSHLDWERQFSSSTLKKYRIVTYDLRGHGMSGKPEAARYYQEGKRWGDELNTVLQAKHLKHPVLVGWSMGAFPLTNYVSTYGTAKVAGLVYVGAVFELRPELLGQHPAVTMALTSSDLAQHLNGTRQFVRLCFYQLPAPDIFNQLVAGAAMASPDMVHSVYGGISSHAEEVLPKLSIPILIIHGEKDVLVNEKMVQFGQRLMPKAKVIRYADTGHASFFERTDRFNRDLDAFVKHAVASGQRVKIH